MQGALRRDPVPGRRSPDHLAALRLRLRAARDLRRARARARRGVQGPPWAPFAMARVVHLVTRCGRSRRASGLVEPHVDRAALEAVEAFELGEHLLGVRHAGEAPDGRRAWSRPRGSIRHEPERASDGVVDPLDRCAALGRLEDLVETPTARRGPRPQSARRANHRRPRRERRRATGRARRGGGREPRSMRTRSSWASSGRPTTTHVRSKSRSLPAARMNGRGPWPRRAGRERCSGAGCPSVPGRLRRSGSSRPGSRGRRGSRRTARP